MKTMIKEWSSSLFIAGVAGASFFIAIAANASF